MAYTGRQVSLLVHAAKLDKLGYTVGLAKGKALAKLWEPWSPNPFAAPSTDPNMGDWDGLSIVLHDGTVCVDFDEPDFGLIGWHPLPPTWKERSPHGYHLLYRIPSHIGRNLMTPKIKWRPGVDLLIRDADISKKQSSYGGGVGGIGSPFFGHVIVSPTDGYKRLWPEEGVPEQEQLPVAPDWLVEALRK